MLHDAKGQAYVTTVHSAGGLSGRLISRGNLVSQIVADNGVSGVIAVQGNLGATAGHTRLGGLVANGTLQGKLVVLGNSMGDIVVHGGLQGGQIAVKGDILGNTTIDGTLDAASALVAGGKIGDATLGTLLQVGKLKGIVAANAAINLGGPSNSGSAAFYGANLATNDPSSAAAINAIFTEYGKPLSLDGAQAFDLGGLDLILRDLASLHVNNRHLAGPRLAGGVIGMRPVQQKLVRSLMRPSAIRIAENGHALASFRRSR